MTDGPGGSGDTDKMNQQPAKDEQIGNLGEAMPDGKRAAGVLLLLLRSPEISGLPQVFHVRLQPVIANQREAKQSDDQSRAEAREYSAQIKFFGQQMEQRHEAADALKFEIAFEKQLRHRAGIKRGLG